MDLSMVGRQIAVLRREKGLTQNELGERLGVSYQAVSKWERGETLPDTGILVDLADVLEISVDYLLRGNQMAVNYWGRITVEQMRDGLLAFKRMGELLGSDHLLYRCAVDGINGRLKTDIADAFADDNAFEAFLAEAVIQSLTMGKYVDMTDVKNGFRNRHFADLVMRYCVQFGIK